MKKEEPKVTVVTVTFNLIKDGREKFFRQCVESVHNQTYKNIEHIIQDGASTDGTIDLIKEYADKGWCKLFCEKDKGINDAYNKAIKNSSGKYVFFMNSDDYYFDENAIENCVSRMEKENADYCYGEEKRFERDGKFISKWSPKPEVFWITMPWSHQTMGVKLNVLKKIGNYADELSFGADFPLIQQLILNDYKGVEIPEVISAYRIGGISSAKGDLLKNYQTIFVMSKNLMNFSLNFYPNISLDECRKIICGCHPGNVNVFPPYYRERLIDYLVSKNLKFMDYNKVISCINSYAIYDTGYFTNLKQIPFHSPKTKLYISLFSFLPILKIKYSYNKSKIYFCGIPILRIKKKG